MPPSLLRIVAAVAGWESVEAGKKDAPSLRRFAMTAYTGGPMVVAGWEHPVVVDLAGLHVSAKPRPILKDHNPSLIVGHTDAVNARDGRLEIQGTISGSGRVAQEVVAAADNGFPWQASIGASVRKAVFVPAGKVGQANGRDIPGPVYIARSAILGEVSFVALGADDDTEARLVAHHTPSASPEIDSMDFEQWVAAQGFVLADLSPEQTKNLRAIHAAAHPSMDGKPAAGEAAPDATDAVRDLRARLAAETERVAAIREVCAGKHQAIERKAIADGWDRARAELEVLRAERPTIQRGTGSADPVESKVLEAALCLCGKLEKPERHFTAQVLEQADRQSRDFGLQALLLRAARANGFVGEGVRGDTKGMLQAAFSSLALPGIFSSVANKFLLEGFEAVESTWREIAAIRPVKDFKQVTSYRLTGAFEYEEVGPDGELKHGTVSEESFTNQAKTYGKMFSITRTDIFNDDLGALTAIPRRLGRGAALKLNTVFWRTFLGNAAFFTAGAKNLLAGADTALTIDGLTKAELAFLDQTDADGHPLGISPALLLVPNALFVPSTQLMSATEVREDGGAGTGRKYPTTNPHAGKFRVIRSSYLADTKLPGASVKAWYLLATPGDLPVIEVAFLGGQERPTVESAEADFANLGIQMRGYHDFGVALQDPRAGVKCKGEA